VIGMGLNGCLYCHICQEKALALDNQKDIDEAFGDCMISLFNGSIDIDEVRAFLNKHEQCSTEKDHIVFDIS